MKTFLKKTKDVGKSRQIYKPGGGGGGGELVIRSTSHSYKGIFNSCQIIKWDLLNATKRCHKK